MRQRVRKHLALAGLITLLIGCSTQPRLPVPTEIPTPTWPERVAQLTPMENWSLSGKIGIRVNDQNQAANLSWTQKQAYYHLFMSGPFGQGATTISGTNDHLQLAIAGEPPYSTSEPEQLLYQRLGWSFPLTHLSWWVRGLPAPGSLHQKTLDDLQRLKHLTQSGWQIDYRSYQQIGRLELPAKLIMRRGDQLKLTVVIKQWQPELAAP